MIGSPRTRKLGKKILQKNKETRKKTNFHEGRTQETVVMPPKKTKRATGTVGEGAAGKKAKATQHAGGQSVSEKSQAMRTSKNVFEKSKSNTQYFGRRGFGRRGTADCCSL
jgi:hypothetical protein